MSDSQMPPPLPTPEDTNPAPDEPGGSSGNWWSRLPRWGQWTIGVLAVLILLGIGGAIGSSGGKEDDLNEEVATLERGVTRAEGARDAAEAKAEKAEDAEAAAAKKGKERAATIVEEAEQKAHGIVGSANSESQQLSSKIGKQKGELGSLEGRADSTEAHIAILRGEEGEAEEVAAKSEIGEGVWQAERDYLPGTYEAPGGSSCYWALLSEPGSGGGIEGIIENGGFNKHQILDITSPYFETSNCGTWQRVGE
jgi:hypothetical protein